MARRIGAMFGLRSPQGTDDDILFEYAATNSRVFVTTDEDVPGIGAHWLRKERPFRGRIYWPPKYHRRMSDGDFIRRIEGLADQDDPIRLPHRPHQAPQVAIPSENIFSS